MGPQFPMILGVFERRRLLDYLRHFIFWESEAGYLKKVAAYHQFHAVNKAVEATIRASSEHGDRRIGVVWHTLGYENMYQTCQLIQGQLWLGESNLR